MSYADVLKKSQYLLNPTTQLPCGLLFKDNELRAPSLTWWTAARVAQVTAQGSFRSLLSKVAC